MYSFDEIKDEMEQGELEKALLMLKLFSLEKKLDVPLKWASSELYGYYEVLTKEEEELPWWRFCIVVWINHDKRVIGKTYFDNKEDEYNFDIERDTAPVYFGVQEIETLGSKDIPAGEFKIPPPSHLEESVEFGMVNKNNLYKRIREAGIHLLSDISNNITNQSSNNSLGIAQQELLEFKDYIERQAWKDIFVNEKPQENIARSLLQAFLSNRSYREVPVRGGRTDILSFQKNGRLLYETKIWRGQKYHTQGLREIEEYLKGEGNTEDFIGVFYVIFDSTKSHVSKSYLKSDLAIEQVGIYTIYIITICLAPLQPSKID